MDQNLDEAEYHNILDKGETIPSFFYGLHYDKRYFPSKIAGEIEWFHFQDSMVHSLDNTTNKPNGVLLKSLFIKTCVYG